MSATSSPSSATVTTPNQGETIMSPDHIKKMATIGSALDSLRASNGKSATVALPNGGQAVITDKSNPISPNVRYSIQEQKK